MLYDAADDPGSTSPAELRAAYEAEIRSVVDTVGVDAVADATDVDEATLQTLLDGESPDLTVREAAAILSTKEDTPDADAIVAELRDHLLMGMTTGVLDVDTIAAEAEVDLTGQEVQQAIEGRNAMTLRELAAIHRVIAARNG